MSVFVIVICSVRDRLTITSPNGMSRSSSGTIESVTFISPGIAMTFKDTSRANEAPDVSFLNLTTSAKLPGDRESAWLFNATMMFVDV